MQDDVSGSVPSFEPLMTASVTLQVASFRTLMDTHVFYYNVSNKQHQGLPKRWYEGGLGAGLDAEVDFGPRFRTLPTSSILRSHTIVVA